MDKITHEVRCEQWTQIINECLASGMNKTAWCKANGISNKETPVAFVELKPTKNTTDRQEEFQPDIIIRKKDLVLEISNTASAELAGLLGGFLHAE